MITAITDPNEIPNPLDDQQTFDTKWANLLDNLVERARQENALAATMVDVLAAAGSIAAGGAFSIPYIFDTATADADPGVGKLRLSSATQSSATVMRVDVSSGGQDYTTLLDTFVASTSAVKGSIRLVKQGDATKWMTFNLTARATPTGYRNFTVACTDSSAASPFANGDALMLFFQRNGDKGEDAVGALQLLGQATVGAAVAQVDFLNIFTSAYDKYVIELQNFTPAAAAILRMRMAVAGVVDTASLYTFPSSNGGQGGSSSALDFYGSNGTYATMTLEVRNANGANMTSIGARGSYFSTASGNTLMATLVEGAYRGAGTVSGFRLYFSAGNISAGTVRVYGVKNA